MLQKLSIFYSDLQQAHLNMNPRGLEQAAEEQVDTIPSPFIDLEQVRKRYIRAY